MRAGSLEGLSALGAAAVSTSTMASLAAVALGEPSVDLLSASATEISLPMFNMTTGGLWRVAGTAIVPGAGGGVVTEFSTVLKVIQSPLLWAGIGQIPPDFRDALTQNFPWHTEADVYASNLAEAIPEGGRLPTLYRIEKLDPQRTAIWMEDVHEDPATNWDDARFISAAALLGRLAGSSAVRAAGPEIPRAMDPARLRFFLDGVGSQVLMPSIRGEDLWRTPAVAAVATAPLVAGLRGLADRAYDLVEEIAALPALPAHGDASPQNLLADGATAGSPNFAVIDWGMYTVACAGFDLGQLLAGWVNQGAMDGSELHRLEPLCLAAYCQGLAESGTNVPETVVRRGHATSMALFTGLTAVPSQRLAEPDSAELHTFMAGRVAMAGFVLDLLAATE